jgi:hypothetical protein
MTAESTEHEVEAETDAEADVEAEAEAEEVTNHAEVSEAAAEDCDAGFSDATGKLD